MKKFWKKQVPAMVLALIMVAGMMPAALATQEGEGGSGTGGENPAPPHTHTAKPVWSSNSEGHYHECTGCEEKLDFAGHTSSKWAVVDEEMHEKKCTVCGYVIETGTHNISQTVSDKDDATCYQAGKEYYACTDGCGYREEKTIPATGAHVAADVWTSDNSHHWHPCTTAGCTYKEFGKAEHSFPKGIYVTSGTEHWQVCSICDGTSAKSPHTPDSTGKCTVCKQQVSGAVYTVTFYYPTSSYRSTYSTVKAGTNGYLTSSTVNSIPCPSSFKYDGKTYEFYGWTDTHTNDFIYTGRQSTKSPTSTKITNNGFEFYALYTTESDAEITYTVDPGKEESFNVKDFEKVHDNACSDTFEYVSFNVTKGTYNSFSGKLYDGSTELSYSDLKGDFYYDEDDATKDDYALEDLTLAAPKGADDDSITISFTTYGTKGKTTSGTLKLVVGDDEGDDDIVYKVAPGGTVEFDEDDFNDVYQDLAGTSRDIQYVIFTASSDYTSFDGNVYVKSKSFTRSTLNNATFYYGNYGSSTDYSLSDLKFTADRSADDGDSLTLEFRAYRTSSDYEDGTLKIVIDDNASGSGDITYKVAAGKEVAFDEDDFNDYYQEEADTSNDIKWVEFSTTDTLSSSEGTIYYDYGYSDQKSFTKSTIDDYKFYYGRSSSSGEYALDDLSFVAGKNASDHTVELSFRAYYSSTRYADGTLAIQVGDGADAGDVTVKVKPGKYTDLDKTDFQAYLRSECGDKRATLDYVRFDRPSSSVFSDLTLYSDYGKSSQTSFSASSLNGYTFYYDSRDATGSKEYGLDTLTFDADASFKESVKLTFTVYGDDDEEEEGTLVIQPDGAAAGTSNYVGSIRYNVTSGNRVQINANDIARFFKRNAGTNMQYVTLTGVPSTGSLYYNYYNTSKYGTSSRAQLTASNCSGQNFYASPTSNSQFALTELTYVPSGKNYCATIPFTAYGGSRSVSGAILISVTSAAVAEVYGVAPKGTAVTFPASDISKAVSAATGTAPSSIQLLSLPSYTAGAVYVGSGTSTAADTSTAYTIFNGTQSLRFVPASSHTGNVEIPYVALNSSGVAMASGTFSLGVVKAKKSFSDVNSSTWCYKYVAELSDAGVIAGYANGSFKPNNTVTYGAALKLIMLAAGYPEQAPTVKNSPFSGYLAKARADGIVTRSNVNLSGTITRQQVAQLAAGAMKLDTSNLSTVQPFTDTTDASIRALNAAGIVEGYFSNGTSTFKPNNTLTRGQISAIVWRMRNYK